VEYVVNPVFFMVVFSLMKIGLAAIMRDVRADKH
jgi:hypothetical protein